MKNTDSSAASAAKRFYEAESSSTWLIFGGSTPWAVESEPPAEDTSLTAIPGVVVARLASLRLVVLDPAGDIQYWNASNEPARYREVTPENAVAEGATRVLITTSVMGNEAGADAVVRILGVSCGLTRTGVSNTVFPSEIINQGELQGIEYRPPLYLTATSLYSVSVILEF